MFSGQKRIVLNTLFMHHFKRLPEATSDGSLTFYIPEIDEHYHSTNGAVVEANHVYLQEALSHYYHHRAGDEKQPIRILEVGFGTGLNAFLTLIKAEELGIPVYFTTLELYPLSTDQIKMLNYPAQIAPDKVTDYEALHTAAWDHLVNISTFFSIEKREMDLVNQSLDGVFDVVYFDAFAPDKQPEMWSDAIYKKIFDVVSPGGVLTTYCAKGVVRRGFQSAGFAMERIPGPPGKREMLRATKPI